MIRKQCEVTDSKKIEAILSMTTIGRMASIDSQGYPYITPVNFVYYAGKIYFHCASRGEKLDNIAENPKVCFEVDIPLAYLDAEFTENRSPCNLHQFYHCVIIRGTAAVVADGLQKVDALNALVAKHEKGTAVGPVRADMAAYRACRVVEITPVVMTAKSELAQGKSPKVRAALARHFKQRDGAAAANMIRAMGFDADAL